MASPTQCCRATTSGRPSTGSSSRRRPVTWPSCHRGNRSCSEAGCWAPTSSAPTIAPSMSRIGRWALRRCADQLAAGVMNLSEATVKSTAKGGAGGACYSFIRFHLSRPSCLHCYRSPGRFNSICGHQRQVSVIIMTAAAAADRSILSATTTATVLRPPQSGEDATSFGRDN